MVFAFSIHFLPFHVANNTFSTLCNRSGSVVVSWSAYSHTQQITEAELQNAIDTEIIQQCYLQDSGLQLRPDCSCNYNASLFFSKALWAQT